MSPGMAPPTAPMQDPPAPPLPVNPRPPQQAPLSPQQAFQQQSIGQLLADHHQQQHAPTVHQIAGNLAGSGSCRSSGS